MDIHLLDAGIVVAMLVVLTVMAIFTNRYTRSVADFLAANRCAGRYLLSVSYGIAGLGAITMIAGFQEYQQAGFTVN